MVPQPLKFAGLALFCLLTLHAFPAKAISFQLAASPESHHSESNSDEDEYLIVSRTLPAGTIVEVTKSNLANPLQRRLTEQFKKTSERFVEISRVILESGNGAPANDAEAPILFIPKSILKEAQRVKAAEKSAQFRLYADTPVFETRLGFPSGDRQKLGFDPDGSYDLEPTLAHFGKSTPDQPVTHGPLLNMQQMMVLFVNLIPKARQAGLTPAAINNVVGFLRTQGQRIRNRAYITIVDFTQPSTSKRLYVFDLGKGKIWQHYVAHGKNSGVLHATRFSNGDGDNTSSLGFYLTGEGYQGIKGLSVRLDGLDPSNDLARLRSIVIHGSEYVDESFIRRNKRIGRSLGCFAMPYAFIYGKYINGRENRDWDPRVGPSEGYAAASHGGSLVYAYAKPEY